MTQEEETKADGAKIMDMEVCRVGALEVVEPCP
jgi:hypothetical protein